MNELNAVGSCIPTTNAPGSKHAHHASCIPAPSLIPRLYDEHDQMVSAGYTEEADALASYLHDIVSLSSGVDEDENDVSSASDRLTASEPWSEPYSGDSVLDSEASEFEAKEKSAPPSCRRTAPQDRASWDKALRPYLVSDSRPRRRDPGVKAQGEGKDVFRDRVDHDAGENDDDLLYTDIHEPYVPEQSRSEPVVTVAGGRERLRRAAREPYVADDADAWPRREPALQPASPVPSPAHGAPRTSSRAMSPASSASQGSVDQNTVTDEETNQRAEPRWSSRDAEGVAVEVSLTYDD